MDLSYILNHLGEDREAYFNSVSPPVFESSNFSFASVAEMRKHLKDEMDYPFYTRGHNPTVAILRKKLAALEEMEECLVFGSGSAAVAAAVLSSVQQGDHIVSVKNPYSWTGKLMSRYLGRFGVTVTYVEGTDPLDFSTAMQPNTRLFYLESPNSFTFVLQDIVAITDIARSKGITTILDNSFSSPLLQTSGKLGVDIVVHSGTKYLNGHSDVIAGVLCTDRKRAEHIFETEFMNIGAILSPHNAWLMLRGLRTLPIRLKQSAETTAYILSKLETHPRVEKIWYPHHPSHPQYELAQKQMKGSGGQFSISLRIEGPEEIDKFCDQLQYFLLACSWGGYESLVFPVAGLSGTANYKESPHPWNLIRFYVGLEEPEVLWKDLKQALDNI